MELPLDKLTTIEKFAFEMLHMDRETVMDSFDDVYEDTREKSFATLVCKGMYQCFPVEKVEGDEVIVAGGAGFKNEVLARNLRRAEELVLYAVTVHGFEELINNPDNDAFDGMFYNAWGIGVSMSAHRWLKAHIADLVHGTGKFIGRSWIPGEDKIELSLQKDLYELLDPSQIDVKLLENMLMSPMMTVSGFMGISGDAAIETDGLEEASFH